MAWEHPRQRPGLQPRGGHHRRVARMREIPACFMASPWPGSWPST